VAIDDTTFGRWSRVTGVSCRCIATGCLARRRAGTGRLRPLTARRSAMPVAFMVSDRAGVVPGRSVTNVAASAVID
jgi:hypothetical protein